MSGTHGVADVRDEGRDSPASTEQLTKCGEKEVSDQDCLAIGSRLRGAMGTRRPAKFWPQLWATVVRNLLLKKRDTRKTLAEVLVPLYSLGVLIFLKMLVPNPNFPEVRKPGRLLRIHHDAFPENHSVAVVADWLNANGTMGFLEEINSFLAESHQHPIRWIKYNNNSELNDAYHNDAKNFPIAVIFHTDPTSNTEALRYTIRTNPSHIGTPSTRTLTTSPAKCRERTASKDWSSDWSRGGQLIPLSEMHGEDTCPVLQYYYSGFLALQTLIDYIKIKFDTDAAIPPPRIDLRQFPKRQHTGDWLVIFRVIMPMYMVMTLSQFITYLLMFVVGEKEKKIREGMRIMGLKESVYWGSWFLIYAVFVTILSIVSTVLLFTLKVFQHSSYILIFLLMLLFGFTIITFAFMLTPFFDRARTAGILGSFAVNLMSGLYFIQVFVSNADSLAFWFVSLISSSCYALAMDKALVLDMAGVGVTWDNLWSGPGVPFGGSLIMMAIDTVLYGLAAYWLDAVIPSEYGIKQKPWFCLLPSFWIGSRRGRVSAVHFHSNGEAASHNKDIEPVPRELQDKEAIRIVGLQKSFRHCRKPEIKAIDNIDLSIYEGQITAVLGHNGAGKSTLFNILTGLTAPTNGTAYVYGLDVRDPNDMHEIRQMIGVCPQQDVLFDLLSVKEHLQFFAAVKGIPHKRLPEEIHKALSDVGLLDQTNVFAKHLSGGQKRKLSIAIAFIGDPKEDAPIELYTDASSIGYGAVLVQTVGGRQHPVAYMSQRTTDAESRYHSYELETLAVVRAVKHFRHYIYGRKFKVITDCNALKASKNKKDLLPRIHRWWAFLQNYEFEVEYRKGERLQHADFFSRNPSTEISVNFMTRDTEWLQIEQRRDDVLRPLIDTMSGNSPAEGYVLEEGVLKKTLMDSILGIHKPIVVPRSFQWSLINSFHVALQHPGWEKTLQKLRETYWFDKMSTIVRRFVDNCVVCKTSKGPSGAIQAQLHPIQKPTAAFQVIHMDITGKLGTRSAEGRDEYVIVAIDAYTKYILLSYSNDKSPSSSLAALKRVVHLFGTPVQVVVDGGREFLGEFKVYADRVGIDIHSIAPGVSRANGQVERIMGTLKNALTMIKNYDTEEWQTALEALQLAFNCTPHRVTGVAPLTLLTRRQHSVPPELLRLVNINDECIDFDLLEQHVQEKMTAAGQYDKQRFDRSKAKMHPFQRGDYVLVKNNPRNQTSLDLKYSEPYEIYRILDNDRYIVKRVTGRGRPRKVAHDQLRRAPQPGEQETVSTNNEDDLQQVAARLTEDSSTNLADDTLQQPTSQIISTPPSKEPQPSTSQTAQLLDS